MADLSALAFSQPALLLGLLGLPVLWWLLRITPPRARDIRFPPLRLILDLKPEQKTPAQSPWWLTVLRLCMAALLLMAMAGPVWHPIQQQDLPSRHPLLILFDDGWASAPDWSKRQAFAEGLITAASEQQQAVVVLAFSHPPHVLNPVPARTALSTLKSLAPVAFTPDRHSHLDSIAELARTMPDLDIAFISDGLALRQSKDSRQDFLQALANLPGSHTLTIAMATDTAWVIKGRHDTDTGLAVHLARAHAGTAKAHDLVLRDNKDRVLGRKAIVLGAEDSTKEVDFTFPLELRRAIARIEIEEQQSAAAVWLSDQAQNRKRVALISESQTESGRVLLSPTTYLTRALSPYAEIRQTRLGTVEAITALLEENPAMLILADSGQLPESSQTQLKTYMQQGGLVLRFASPALALSHDALVPVSLRRGGRMLGGALSWDTPRSLAPFEKSSPFADLVIPADVQINRQILAEPAPDLGPKVWAHLMDGTPLVTADHHGKGLLVLFHVSADASWSSLPLSGLFVSMLQTILSMGHEPRSDTFALTAPQEDLLSPLRLLDGYGHWQTKSNMALPLDTKSVTLANRDHPAGFYGTMDAPAALNILSPDVMLQPLDTTGLAIRRVSLDAPQPLDLRPWLLGLFALLFIIDSIAVLLLNGSFSLKGRSSVLMVPTLLVLGLFVHPIEAGELSSKDKDSALATRLAYIVTGDPTVDEFSRIGLTELSAFLSARTALEPAAPVGVHPSQDELGVYPLLYWPMLAKQRTPDAKTIGRIDAYMKNGGTILFDTRDAALQTNSGTPTAETKALQAILSQITVPPLDVVPPQHVILKTFFLIDQFPGRTANGKTYIEATQTFDPQNPNISARNSDGVSSLIITSNDLAAAWASGASGSSLNIINQTIPRQREMALRGGANIVMYVLTGNYKSDQVHVPALLERLGQ